MAKKEETLVKCIQCAELIHETALKCKHCKSYVLPRKAPHAGTCQFCREQIDPEARVCKHCHSGVISVVDGSIFTSAQARRRQGIVGTNNHLAPHAEKKDDDKDGEKKKQLVCVDIPLIICTDRPDTEIAGYITSCDLSSIHLCQYVEV